jgi:hypothetical protein
MPLWETCRLVVESDAIRANLGEQFAQDVLVFAPVRVKIVVRPSQERKVRLPAVQVSL